MMTTSPAPFDDLKRQLAQLDELITSGVLAGTEARARRDALEAEILARVMQPAAPAAPAEPRASRGLVSAIAAFVLVVGLGGYASYGRLDAWTVGPGAVAEVPSDEQINAMVSTLSERMKSRPDDAEGWAMLARSYTALGRYPEALAAFKRVLELKPGDAQALADYADALAVTNDRKLEGEPERLVMQAVQADGNNVKALALAGTIAYNRDDFKGAVGYWERAVNNSDPEGAFARELQGALTEARQRAGGNVGAGQASTAGATLAARPPAASAATAGAASISGEVRLGAALAAQAGPDDTVFIYARPVEGPRMPLAIVRLKVRDLPAQFTLDDSLAMSPAARLSSAQQVVVGARVSKTGNAIAQPGDLQVTSGPVAVNTRGLLLEITELVR